LLGTGFLVDEAPELRFPTLISREVGLAEVSLSLLDLYGAPAHRIFQVRVFLMKPMDIPHLQFKTIHGSCFRRKHSCTGSHDPVRQAFLQVLARNLGKASLKISEAQLSFRIQIGIMESLTEESDNLAQGQDLLDPCRLVLSSFAGHEPSRVYVDLGKRQRKIWLLQYPDPTAEGSHFPYPQPDRDCRVLVNADL